MEPRRATQDSGAEQATTTRKRGSRGRGRALRRQIQRAAQERQEAWRETGQPLTTEKLTDELDELYVEHRHNHPESGSAFRRPTPEMRSVNGKSRGLKPREPRVDGPVGEVIERATLIERDRTRRPAETPSESEQAAA